MCYDIWSKFIISFQHPNKHKSPLFLAAIYFIIHRVLSDMLLFSTILLPSTSFTFLLFSRYSWTMVFFWGNREGGGKTKYLTKLVLLASLFLRIHDTGDSAVIKMLFHFKVTVSEVGALYSFEVDSTQEGYC